MTYVYDFLIVIAAILTTIYVQGFLFAAVKADQHEDRLANKIAVAVVKGMKEEI